MLHDFFDWNIQFHSHQNIKGVKIIAESVIKEYRFQSYIAVRFPP